VTDHIKTLASLDTPRAGTGTAESKLCLSEDEILSFVKGDVRSSHREKVHAHLDSCVGCQQLVAEAAHALDSEPFSESTLTSWNTVFQAGAEIARRYRIIRLVARGDMGEVYEAFDMALREPVALKTITATHCDSAKAIRLLKAEVQLARRIGHPNVCRIFDLGTHVMEPSGGEIQFLVMQFVEGECLGKKLRQSGALPVPTAILVAKQLLEGLAAAHQAGILHRDFKSDNVMLRTESNGPPTAVILDFGLAKALNEAGNMVTTRQAQSIVGTFGYMAPEQIESEPLSVASDIYAFGVVWFEMLTGRLPFEAGTPAASAVVRLHRAAEQPSRHNPNVPKWIDSVVLRCLERKRSERFSSVQEVLQALDAGSLVSSTRVQAVHRSRRFRSSIIGLCVIASVPAGLGYYFVRPSYHSDAPLAPPANSGVVAKAPAATTHVSAVASVTPSPVEGEQILAKRPKLVAHKSEKSNAAPSAVAPAPQPASATSSALVEASSTYSVKPEASSEVPLAATLSEPDWLPLKKMAQLQKRQ